MLTNRNLALSEGEVYSQPTNTGVGQHENTQLVAAIDALKVCLPVSHPSVQHIPFVSKISRLYMVSIIS